MKRLLNTPNLQLHPNYKRLGLLLTQGALVDADADWPLDLNLRVVYPTHIAPSDVEMYDAVPVLSQAIRICLRAQHNARISQPCNTHMRRIRPAYPIQSTHEVRVPRYSCPSLFADEAKRFLEITGAIYARKHRLGYGNSSRKTGWWYGQVAHHWFKRSYRNTHP